MFHEKKRRIVKRNGTSMALNMHILTGGNWVARVGAPGKHRVLGVLSVLRDPIFFPAMGTTSSPLP